MANGTSQASQKDLTNLDTTPHLDSTKAADGNVDLLILDTTAHLGSTKAASGNVERIQEWVHNCKPEQHEDVADAQSQISGSSVTSEKVRLKEAMVKKRSKEMRLKALLERQKLEAQMLELRQRQAAMALEMEVEEACMEEVVWREDIMGCSDEAATKGNQDDSEVIIARQQPESRLQGSNASPVPPSQNDPVQILASAIQEKLSLPKTDILTFSGNPLDYHKFVYNFDATVANSVSSDQVRLTYLIQYCFGEAKRAIEDCVLLPPKEGYARARNILKERYGQPHEIVRSFMGQLINGPAIKPNDRKGLSDLALEMSKCELNLSQMGYACDMNNQENLRQIVHRLPVHMRGKWAESAWRIMESGRQATFEDLTMFINKQARIANTIFGMDMSKDDPAKRDFSHKEDRHQRVTTLSTNSQLELPYTCPCCDRPDCLNLAKCTAFVKMDQGSRLALCKEARVCFNCFRSITLQSGVTSHLSAKWMAAPTSITSYCTGGLLWNKQLMSKPRNKLWLGWQLLTKPQRSPS